MKVFPEWQRRQNGDYRSGPPVGLDETDTVVTDLLEDVGLGAMDAFLEKKVILRLLTEKITTRS